MRNPVLSARVTTVESPQWLNLPRSSEPRKIFDSMWDKDIFEYLRHETNRLNSGGNFTPVSLGELCRFFGQHIVFGALGLPATRDLWRKHGFEVSYTAKESGLPCNRWEEINSHLKFNPSTLRDRLVRLFQAHMIPGTNLTCDETRIRAYHKGAPEVEFNPTKPERWAVQSYCLNLSNKYLYDFTLPKEKTGFNALIHFADRLKNTGRVHHITADTHFSNVAQAQQILDKGVFSTLCCKVDSAPKDLFAKGLAKGLPQWRSRFATKDQLVAACLHRKKKVCIVTSWYKITNVKKSNAAERRVLIDHYDSTKREADHFNHLVSNYHTHRKHRDVKINMLLGWFEFSLTNAYIIYSEKHKDALSHRDFLLSVSASLLLYPWE